ncbi:host specificity factor TipJ family phage tail protein [Psychrobacter namhaensis]|uniref:host specificity factor TipJ family phage tail protein n=1 Tax=Psychrobacter namhaensis TaxID=292734 RepID=UPI0018DF673A|nr:host specificity factor TipJ family phage tail protein [Psychrobacter namhaensis]
MNLFRRSIELVVIRDIFNPQNNIETYTGYDVEKLLKQAFGGNGLSESVRLYHGNLLDEVTPKTPQDVDKVMRLHGRIYAVVKPMGLDPISWAIIGISVLASVAVAFLMPVPDMGSQNQPPSPNNALAARTNKQRLGGRVPDIFGTVWSVPDLIAPTYSVYIDSKEIEYSYMCVGRGRYDTKDAYDDTTPIRHVAGSGVLVYDPDTNLNDAPSNIFGEQFTPSEASFARLAAKRYTSVNGQTLPYPNSYHRAEVVFKSPNIIESVGEFDMRSVAKVGEIILIENANGLTSSTGAVNVDNTDPENPIETPVIYNFDGSYEVAEVTSTQVKIVLSGTQVQSWDDLALHNDTTNVKTIVLSAESSPLWQGWYYTEDRTHDGAMVNIIAPSGLYVTSSSGNVYGRRVEVNIESELVDSNDNAIAGTYHSQLGDVYALDKAPNPSPTTEDERRQTAANTIRIENPNYVKGSRMRVRVSRKTPKLYKDEGSVVQEVKIADFYSYRVMTAADMPKGVTTVYTKTRATEGALSLKERKLRLLVQRYVTDATSGLPKLSNRADDIIRHVMTDPKIGNLQLTQVDIAQIKTEIDAQIAYFGTSKCSEFCGTFDDNNLSAEETMQIVAKAVFSQAKRQGNKIMLDFERKVPASVAVFNSHNILPDTFTAPQSLGIANDYDGVKVEYTDPVDDAVITMSYPNDAIVNPHEDKLIGVRNEVQAHTHMMRMYNKDRHAYKSCEFVAGDESNIVVRTNRITVADQLRADVQQGSVDSIETIGGDIVLHTTDPVSIDDSVAHTLFIQTINNGVESIAVTARDDYSVKLARLPSGEISGTDKAVQAVYQIVSETDGNRDAYLVAQKDPSDGMTNKLLCTNYDDRYYQNDSDFTNGLIA